MKKAICIISGGMDSAVCAYKAKIEENYEIVALHFNYGQRTQNRELKAFRDICDSLGVQNKYEIDIDFFKQIGSSALTDFAIDVPLDDFGVGIPVTYVPFRNGIFLSIAAAIAEKERAEAIYIGVVQEDSSGYPDCSADFIIKMQNAINQGTKPDFSYLIKTPLVNLKKEDIVMEAVKLNVPLELTWSCYKNEEKACGKCDSCFLRLKGFKNAKIKDNILYEIY